MSARRRLFFDVSVLPELGSTVTGISRVIVSLIRCVMLEHPALEACGLRFHRDRPGCDLLGTAQLARLIVPFVPDARLPEGPDAGCRAPGGGDIILLLGEQWLFPDALPYAKRLKQKSGVNVVSLIHDLVPFFMPELYWDGFPEDYRATITRLVELSDALLVNSACTRKDLLREFPRLNEAGAAPVAQLRLGDVGLSDQAGPGAAGPGFVVPRPFLLSVGTIQPRKNHMLLLYVWRMLLEADQAACPGLVIAGKRGWNVENLLYFIDRNPLLCSRIMILDEVSDAALGWLYRNCLMTAYPSIYEGWGLPVAESLQAGKMCLASHAGSLPEIAGDLIEYFSPYDSGEAYRLIRRYLDSPDLVRERERLIRERYRPTTWTETTLQLVTALRPLAQPAR